MTRRDELMAEYKLNRHRLRRMGVYQIKNVVSGRVLLGYSSNLDGVLQRERGSLDQGRHMNLVLQADLNACGPDAFHDEGLGLGFPKVTKPRYRKLADLLSVVVCRSRRGFV